jgi:hypothetical protein
MSSTSFHGGQIVRISDLSRLARVSDHGSGRNADNDGDCLHITEIRDDDQRPSNYGYLRKDGEGWTDCHGETPVTIELVEDAPLPYRVGYEEFFTQMMEAILEGEGVLLPSVTAEFVEKVRNHAAYFRLKERWHKLALARLRGGYFNPYEPEAFIKEITAFDDECAKAHERREAFFGR